MRDLSAFIEYLSKEEIRNFKLFAERVGAGNKKKTVFLFDLLKKRRAVEDEELVNLLFGEDNKNAYYRLKNKLYSDVERSLLMLYHNLDDKTRVMNCITLARLFRQKNNQEETRFYLEKAEKIASKNQLYDLLVIVYDELLNLSAYDEDLDPIDLIEKRKNAHRMQGEIYSLKSAMTVMSNQLKRANYGGTEVDINQELDSILINLKFPQKMLKSVDVKLAIHECFKKSQLQKKDYKNLLAYLKSSWEDLNSIYTEQNHDKKIIHLIWIVNTALKNQEYEQMRTYQKLLHTTLNEWKGRFWSTYSWSYWQADLQLHFYNDNINQALSLLEEIRNSESESNQKEFNMFFYPNCCSLRFCKGEYKEAVKSLSYFKHLPMFKNLSGDLRLGFFLVEVLIYIEMEEMELAFYKLNEIKRNFRKILTNPVFERQSQFVKILNSWCKFPNPEQNPKILDAIQDFIKDGFNVEIGSNELISYEVWILSKLNERGYYAELLEQIGKKKVSTELISAETGNIFS